MLLAFILLSLNVNAVESYELTGGSLTYHVIAPPNSTQFSNRVSADGRLIDNPLFGIQRVLESRDYYTSLGFFVGKESVGGQMAGFKWSSGIKARGFYFGLVLGGYGQSTSGFIDRGIIPFQVAQVGDVGIVPIVGAEINYRVNLTKSYYVKLNNIVSPVITNTTISLGVSF